MASHIQADYDQLQQVAQSFSQEAENIQQWAGIAINTVEALRSSWSGEAATKFFNEWDMISPNLHKLTDALQTTASQINEVSRIFSEAEQSAVSTMNRAG
jgi:WXG100 family type VII secretion target